MVDYGINSGNYGGSVVSMVDLWWSIAVNMVLSMVDLWWLTNGQLIVQHCHFVVGEKQVQ